MRIIITRHGEEPVFLHAILSPLNYDETCHSSKHRIIAARLHLYRKKIKGREMHQHNYDMAAAACILAGDVPFLNGFWHFLAFSDVRCVRTGIA